MSGAIRRPETGGYMHDNGNQEPPHGAVARPRLFESLKAAIETRHYSRRTQDAYLHWIKRSCSKADAA